MAQKVRPTFAEQFVEYALQIDALELIPKGRKLKNGRLSPYFFNSGLFCAGQAIDEIATAYSNIITEKFVDVEGEPTFDLLYGPPYKGTILVPVIASVQNTFGFGNIRFCTSRKEEKDHGEGGSLIGSLIKPGDRVLIADDVIVDGGTKRTAVDFIRYYGGVLAGLVIAFDRQERGSGELLAIQQFEKDYEVPAHAVATLADLISVLKRKLTESGDDAVHEILAGMTLEQVLAYQKQYGAVPSENIDRKNYDRAREAVVKQGP